MPPLVITILKCILVVIFLLGMTAGAWANTRMMNRARSAGYRWWSVNPLAMFAGLSVADTLLFFAGWLTCAVAVLGLSRSRSKAPREPWISRTLS